MFIESNKRINIRRSIQSRSFQYIENKILHKQTIKIISFNTNDVKEPMYTCTYNGTNVQKYITKSEEEKNCFFKEYKDLWSIRN